MILAMFSSLESSVGQHLLCLELTVPALVARVAEGHSPALGKSDRVPYIISGILQLSREFS
jgi:hypothetical protein